MTVVRETQLILKGPEIGASGRFPAMLELVQGNFSSNLGEDDGLFVDYGMFHDLLPFTMQDQYDGEVKEQSFQAIELENDYLKAVFVPCLGGRLWSLFDKVGQRDLLLSNHELRPNNLAIRNAWLAGGAEYNIGRRGHDEQTCSPRFTALLEDEDGTPVVRFYEFDRDRCVPFQLDFYLPERSRFLFLRVRIMNVNATVVPMYWWSNLAVAMVPGQRVVAPCAEAYANMYQVGGGYVLSKIPLPDGEGFDATYPENFPCAKDHFYNIPPESRKYEAVIRSDGRGFLYASTRRLQSRKLFVWGATQGGRHWQRKLLSDDVPDYLEIQGGLAKTQQECLPMPPRTTWEWLEAYGAIQVEPQSVFGEWPLAIQAVTRKADEILPEVILDQELKRTKSSFALKPGRVIVRGSGWGALEELRRGGKFAAHLDFGEVQPEQSPWVELLRNGALPALDPVSYLVQPEWNVLLEKASSQTWQTFLHRGYYAFHQGDYSRAAELFRKSHDLKETTWNLHALANLARIHGDAPECLRLLEVVVLRDDADISLVKESLKVMVAFGGNPHTVLKLLDCQPEAYRRKPMFRFFRAWALANTGELDAAAEILLAGGGLEIPDIREGEISITDLYLMIQRKKARRAGKTPLDQEIAVPFQLDLRVASATVQEN